MSVRVTASDAVGPFTRITLARGFEPGEPGQFHMLRALDGPALLGRPLSAVSWDADGVSFLCQARGPALRALCRVGGEVDVLGPFGRGFAPARGLERPLLVGGGFGAALLAPLAQRLPDAVLVAGFRDAAQAAAAALVPASRRVVVTDPRSVLEPLSAELPGADAVFAAGPSGLVRAVAAACVERGVACQVALEAPMACGFGACHGCAVRLDGRLVRLCLEGPVVAAARLGLPAPEAA